MKEMPIGLLHDKISSTYVINCCAAPACLYLVVEWNNRLTDNVPIQRCKHFCIFCYFYIMLQVCQRILLEMLSFEPSTPFHAPVDTKSVSHNLICKRRWLYRNRQMSADVSGISVHLSRIFSIKSTSGSRPALLKNRSLLDYFQQPYGCKIWLRQSLTHGNM